MKLLKCIRLLNIFLSVTFVLTKLRLYTMIRTPGVFGGAAEASASGEGEEAGRRPAAGRGGGHQPRGAHAEPRRGDSTSRQ